jgi:hypothetical protein
MSLRLSVGVMVVSLISPLIALRPKGKAISRPESVARAS